MFTSFSLSNMPFGYHGSDIFINESADIIIWILINFLVHLSPTVSNEHVVNPSSETLFWSHSLLCDQEDVHHSINIVRKNDSTLCWNIHTPVTGFYHRYVLLCAILIFRTSSLDNLLPSCSATAWINIRPV